MFQEDFDTWCCGVLPLPDEPIALLAWQDMLRDVIDCLPEGTAWSPDLWDAVHNGLAGELPFLAYSHPALYEWFAARLGWKAGESSCPSCGRRI